MRDERTDTVIAKDAVQALQSHTNAPDRVTVTVRRGRVTLEGTVEWTYQKAAAESAVKYLKGVRSVANLIRIIGAMSRQRGRQCRVLVGEPPDNRRC